MSATGEKLRAAEDGPLARAWQLLIGLGRRSLTTTLGVGILLVFLVLAIFAPWIAPLDPVMPDPDRILEAPSAARWFGTDINGMDVFSRVIHGARYAFLIAIPTVLLALLLGVPIGLVAGYHGGLADDLLIRFTDTLRVFPSIILALAVVAALGPSILNVVLTLGVLDMAIYARLVRAETLALRSGGFVEAARAAGNPPWRVMFLHVLPNASQGALAQTAVRGAWAVRIGATLAFLGVGVQPPTPEWGVMIRQGAEFMVSGQWWVGVYPGLALILLVLGLNLAGDGLQDLLDPRRRGAGRG
jgi:peptide/nickel transport system permease protein